MYFKMIPKAAPRLASILTWTLFLKSILGFQLTTESLCGRHQAHLSSGIMTPRQSPILPNQRMTRDILLKGIWGPSSSSSSSSSDDQTDGENVEKETETEKAPTDDVVADTSMSPVDTSSENDDAAESSTTGTEKSVLFLVNEIGNNFKVMAQKSTANGYQSEDQKKKIILAAKACIYYTLFIIYRSYRGFFVLLPATFRQVYQNMEAAMKTRNLSMEEIGLTKSGEDMTQSSPKWGTKITVSILTTVITISYVLGGILKMVSKFIRTIAKTSDVPKSFGAAADEVMNFEDRISRVGKVDEEEGFENSGLAP